MAIHASATNCVLVSNDMIIAPHTNTPKVETTGTNGTAFDFQLYFFSTSRAITMRMTSEAPSVIMRLR